MTIVYRSLKGQRDKSTKDKLIKHFLIPMTFKKSDLLEIGRIKIYKMVS